MVIPYWWNKSIESIAILLRRLRPDLIISPHFLNGSEISPNAPKKIAPMSKNCNQSNSVVQPYHPLLEKEFTVPLSTKGW